MPTKPSPRQPGRAVGVPDYLWDARLGNYVNRATGRMVKRTAIQEALGAVCDRGASTLAGIAQAGQNGTLTPRQFYEAMQREVRQLYNASAALGKGGWAQMTPADWGRVGRALRDEYGRLRDFAQGLADGAISEKQAIARARLYADSAYRQYWRSWGGLQAGLGNDEERWISTGDALVCTVCRELEARGWQPLGSLPRPGDPHPGDRCALDFRNSQAARVQPARPPAPDRAAILPPQLAALARARLTQTALTSLALTAELRRPELHYGPVPHPDGSPQQVHGGGSAATRGTADVTTMVKDIAARLGTTLPVDVVQEIDISNDVIPPLGRVLAQFNPQTGRIGIRADVLTRAEDPGAFGTDIRSSAVAGPRAIIAHEIAHAVDTQRGMSKAPEWTRLFAKYKSRAVAAGTTNLPWVISRYSLISAEEAFCEAVATHVVNPAWLGRTNPGMADYLRRAFPGRAPAPPEAPHA